ncbi:helix-turn-helix domain-containing protein [Phaeodactylibacter xiamenensis]|uniref:helix-turn-helix domain-containing protein n=1 Tax=Phaeodactylibacter xiamenensis TaxID=1524460 RepID=UPI0024A8E3E8|nr:helix-turn-helix domain-containing protein [Phaeodactylibacter xiamenensis]
MKNSINQLEKNVRVVVTSQEELQSFIDSAVQRAIQGLQAPAKEPEEELLNFDQACDFLGIAKSTGYQRVNRGELPHFKKGRRLYFRKSELVEYIESGRRKTRKELEEAAKLYLSKSR